MPADTAFLDSLIVKKFGSEIDVNRFSCSEAVEWFLRNKAAEFQDLRLSAVTCWLAGDDLAGFATTNMHALEVESSQDREHLGVSGIVVREGGRHYRLFPALLIGVLGVCTQYRRRGLGERMVKYCVGQALASSVACRFVIVDSEPTEEAKQLYDRCGFHPLPTQDAKRQTVRMYFDLLPPKP